MARPKLYEWDPTLQNTVQSITLPTETGEGTVGGARNAAMRAARDYGLAVVTTTAELVDESTTPATRVGTRIDVVMFDPKTSSRAEARRALGLLEPTRDRSAPTETERDTTKYRREVVCPTCHHGGFLPELERCYRCDPVGDMRCGVCGSGLLNVLSHDLVWVAGSRQVMLDATRSGFSLDNVEDLRKLAEVLTNRADAIAAGADPNATPTFEHGPPMSRAGLREVTPTSPPPPPTPTPVADTAGPADPAAPLHDQPGLDQAYDWSSHL